VLFLNIAFKKELLDFGSSWAKTVPMPGWRIDAELAKRQTVIPKWQRRQPPTRWTKQPIRRTRPVVSTVLGLHRHGPGENRGKSNEFLKLVIYDIL
jgi:hypothetical protein